MSLHLSKCHIVGNHMSRLKFIYTFRINLVNERKDMSFPAVSKKKVQSRHNPLFGVHRKGYIVINESCLI